MDTKKQFTIDEWFYDWLADENKYKAAVKLFLRIHEICDKIILKPGTRLAHKFYQLDEASGKWAPDQRNVVRLIKNLFLSNSEKIWWVYDEPVIAEEVEARLPVKDVYLVKICLQTTDKILITTDTTLYQNLLETKEDLGITPIMLEDFLKEYLQ
ncbi:MAG: hypothetical protein HYR66_12290 [Sphingobacteriales bacterium]|nr:hypothetical protein [Sphingobacteriales bacterium]MBI3718514.1 hypothetical protein [Sphingobacteriales bacterium]